jgi:hypothetical protein
VLTNPRLFTDSGHFPQSRAARREGSTSLEDVLVPVPFIITASAAS